MTDGTMGAVPSGEITDQDKLWAALSYVFAPLVGIIVLLMEENKNRPFQKYHAIQSLAFAVAWVVFAGLLCILSFILGLTGIGAVLSVCLTPLAFAPFLIALYFAYQAYQGQYFEVPVMTDFLKQQGWI